MLHPLLAVKGLLGSKCTLNRQKNFEPFEVTMVVYCQWSVSAVSGHYRTLIAENVGMNAILFSAADSKRELYHFRAVTKGSELGVWELFPYIYIYIYIFPHLPCICFCFFFWLCFLGLFYWSCFLFTALFKNTRTLKVQKPPFQLHFLLLSIIITNTSNKPWNTETHKMDQNPPITNYEFLNLLK